jgi:uncharacterized RDD family membrane protein YckC
MSAIVRSGPTQARPSLWRRLASAGYDLLLVTALLMMLTGLVLAARAGRPFDPQSIWFRLLLLVGWWAYFTWSWTHGGQTVGMRAWRLVLVRPDGTGASLGQASLRFAAAFVSTLALGLGFLWCLVDRRRLTWHDRLSGTELALRSGSAKPEHGERGDDE